MKKERWIEPVPEADVRQDQNLLKWARSEGAPFASPEAQSKFEERCAIIIDAIKMDKTPKRIPVGPSAGHFPIEYAGLTWKEAMYDYKKLCAAFEKYNDDFDPDIGGSGGTIPPGRMFEILDYKPYLWAGNGVGDNDEYQYVENEYMKADEYQDLIDDPTGWFQSVFLPRCFGKLEGFSQFPNPMMTMELPMVSSVAGAYASGPMKSAMNHFMESGEEMLKWAKEMGEFSARSRSKGFVYMRGGFAKAPFDILGDTLRGTMGIMMDLIRRPDEVIEACERLTPLMIKTAVKALGDGSAPFCYMPLHKGADGFMSEKQFESMYWPSLRKLTIGLIDAGIVPVLFAEGGYNSRLDIVSDLPAGKVIWYFDRTDMKRAKETVGRKNCIMGNVPMSLLYGGSTDEVTDYCKNLIATAGKDGGFIFSTGAGMQGTKVENVKVMIECGKKYGGYA